MKKNCIFIFFVISGSLGGYHKGSQRSVQFRYPVAQYQGSHSGDSGSVSGSNGMLFDEDPGIMSEADTSSTSGRKRRQLKAEQGRAAVRHQQHHHNSIKVYRVIKVL